MARRRERFERTDVPKERPHRNLLGLLVVLVVAVVTGLVVHATWERVQLEERLEESDLEDAVAAQTSATVPDSTYVPSGHNYATVPLLGAAPTDASTLTSAELLVIDTDAGTGSIVTLPTSVSVSTSDGVTHTLATLFSAKGGAACVAPLASATNIPVSHVIVSTEDVWDRIAGLQGEGMTALVRQAADLLSAMQTDMGADDLFGLGEKLQAAGGVATLARVDVPLAEETVAAADGSGATGVVVDAVSLGVTLGTLVAAQ